MNLEVELLIKNPRSTNNARLYLRDSFTSQVQTWLKAMDLMNDIMYMDHYILYHIPLFDELKLKARGVIATFNVILLTPESEFLGYVKQKLKDKVENTEWMVMFRMYKRERIEIEPYLKTS